MGKKKTHERGKVKINKKGKQVDGKKKKAEKSNFINPYILTDLKTFPSSYNKRGFGFFF